MVELAPVEAYGEVSWKTPIIKDFKEVPVSEKVDLLLSANAAADPTMPPPMTAISTIYPDGLPGCLLIGPPANLWPGVTGGH